MESINEALLKLWDGYQLAKQTYSTDSYSDIRFPIIAKIELSIKKNYPISTETLISFLKQTSSIVDIVEGSWYQSIFEFLGENSRVEECVNLLHHIPENERLWALGQISNSSEGKMALMKYVREHCIENNDMLKMLVKTNYFTASERADLFYLFTQYDDHSSAEQSDYFNTLYLDFESNSLRNKFIVLSELFIRLPENPVIKERLSTVLPDSADLIFGSISHVLAHMLNQQEQDKAIKWLKEIDVQSIPFSYISPLEDTKWINNLIINHNENMELLMLLMPSFTRAVANNLALSTDIETAPLEQLQQHLLTKKSPTIDDVTLNLDVTLLLWAQIETKLPKRLGHIGQKLENETNFFLDIAQLRDKFHPITQQNINQFKTEWSKIQRKLNYIFDFDQHHKKSNLGSSIVISFSSCLLVVPLVYLMVLNVGRALQFKGPRLFEVRDQRDLNLRCKGNDSIADLIRKANDVLEQMESSSKSSNSPNF